MAYNHGGQYDGRQSHYGQYQEEYVETPADGYSSQYGTHNVNATQTPYTNGSSYAPYNAAGGPVQPPYGSFSDPMQSPRTAQYGQQSYGQQHPPSAPPAASGPPTYNPQQYAQPVSHYNPQDYSSVNRTYSTSSSYNPAAYADPYASRQSAPAQPAYGYSPQPYSAPTFPSPQPSTYSHPSPGLPQPQYAQTYVPSTAPSYATTYNYQTAPQSNSYQQSAPSIPSYTPQTASSTYSQHDWQPSPPPPPVPLRRQSTISPPEPDYARISPALPGLVDELHLPSPPRHGSLSRGHYAPDPLDERQSPSPLYSDQLPSPPAPTPPVHSTTLSRTDTSGRHPQSRPLPGPPVSEPDTDPDYFTSGNGIPYDDYDEQQQAQEDLFSQVENAVMNAGATSPARRQSERSPRVRVSEAPRDPNQQPQPLAFRNERTRNDSKVNGHLSPEPPLNTYEEDSDAEAAAGLEAMRMAEEQDALEESRRQSGGSSLFGGFASQRRSQSQRIAENSGDDSDYATMDMGLYSGGYDAHMTYGGEPDQLAARGSINGSGAYSQPVSAANSIRKSQASSNNDGSFDYGMDTIHPFPPFTAAAQVDAVGTGGFTEPSADMRRQSYDEGDEYALMEDANEPQDLFYHPAVSPYRPLPQLPLHSDSQVPQLSTSWTSRLDTDLQPPYPLDPAGYVQSPTHPGTWVPRSTSLLSQSKSPQVAQPIRSKTDAEERRRQLGYRGSVYDNTPAASSVTLDLPSLPTKRFNAAKLGANDFRKCEEPWALSSILDWLRQIANPEQMTELKESMVKEALVALFTNKVPTMNITDAEVLSNRVVEDMYAAGALMATEEWVKVRPAHMSGVIFQLTQSGCYSPKVHDSIIPGRCYSRHCQRTLRKVNLQAMPTRGSEDWATFYKLKKEDVEGHDKKEIERQNILHEIVQTEDGYMEQLNVLRLLYRDPLTNAEPPVISPKRLSGFLREVFGKVDAIKKANEDHLLPQLKYRQEEQGPWIKGFSDIFRQWIRKAKVAYIEYAAGFPSATLMVRQELERNLEFRMFVDRARNNPLSRKLGWDTYLKAPITRLQRYSLLLFTVHKSMTQDSEEKANLETAMREIKAVTLECDARVAEMQRKVDLADLSQKLVLRPGMQLVELNLNHLGRELVFRGDLQRMGTSRFNWLECHALLFDNYMVLAKTVHLQQKGASGKIEKYDVSRTPIPMDLLVLESTNDEAVMKSSVFKGTTSVSTVHEQSKLGRTISNQSPAPNPLTHTNTSTSVNSMASTTILDKENDKIMYPFRIKHLGREVYTLFAPTAQNRLDWCNKIVEAKTKHAASLFAQNAEPFRLRVMADSAFYFESLGGVSGKSVVIKGTPVDRAIKEVEQRFKDTGRPGPICRARVNCSTSFTTSYPGKHMIAVGTDYGVYVSEVVNPRGWTKAISQSPVTQISVLEEFNLFLLIADKTLIAYHLDVVTNPEQGTGTGTGESARKAPQKLSGSKDVGFFAVGRMKDRTLVFYKKKDGTIHSRFKILEPVFQKSTEKKRGVFKRGTIEFFREYDEFYIPAECSGMNLFQNSLSASTSKGFEVLTLDKKQTFSVPNLAAPEVAAIATQIQEQNTLGMLRLSEQEFLLCYEKCAVYVNKHGDVSRSVIMNFVGKARTAALYGAYLVLFDADFVEIRNAQNGRLKQIIAGKEIKCLDDGGGGSISGGSVNSGVVNGVSGLGVGSRTCKFAMQHPEVERLQILVELVLNEGTKE